MSGDVMLVVLFGAALHASWNAAAKSGHDKQVHGRGSGDGGLGGTRGSRPAVLASAGAGKLALRGGFGRDPRRLLCSGRGGLPGRRHELGLPAYARRGAADRRRPERSGARRAPNKPASDLVRWS